MVFLPTMTLTSNFQRIELYLASQPEQLVRDILKTATEVIGDKTIPVVQQINSESPEISASIPCHILGTSSDFPPIAFESTATVEAQVGLVDPRALQTDKTKKAPRSVENFILRLLLTTCSKPRKTAQTRIPKSTKKTADLVHSIPEASYATPAASTSTEPLRCGSWSESGPSKRCESAVPAADGQTHTLELEVARPSAMHELSAWHNTILAESAQETCLNSVVPFTALSSSFIDPDLLTWSATPTEWPDAHVVNVPSPLTAGSPMQDPKSPKICGTKSKRKRNASIVVPEQGEVEHHLLFSVPAPLGQRRKMRMVLPPTMMPTSEPLADADMINTQDTMSVDPKLLRNVRRPDSSTTSIESLAIAFAWTLKYACTPQEAEELGRTLPAVSAAFRTAFRSTYTDGDMNIARKRFPSDTELRHSIVLQNAKTFQKHWLFDFFNLKSEHLSHTSALLADCPKSLGLRPDEFQIILSVASNLTSTRYLDNHLKPDFLISQTDPDFLAANCTILNPDMACITDPSARSGIVLSLTGYLTPSDSKSKVLLTSCLVKH